MLIKAPMILHLRLYLLEHTDDELPVLRTYFYILSFANPSLPVPLFLAWFWLVGPLTAASLSPHANGECPR